MASASKLLSANPRSHFPNSSFGQTLNFDANKNSLFIDNGFEDTVEIDVPVDHTGPSLAHLSVDVHLATHWVHFPG